MHLLHYFYLIEKNHDESSPYTSWLSGASFWWCCNEVRFYIFAIESPFLCLMITRLNCTLGGHSCCWWDSMDLGPEHPMRAEFSFPAPNVFSGTQGLYMLFGWSHTSQLPEHSPKGTGIAGVRWAGGDFQLSGSLSWKLRCSVMQAHFYSHDE